MQNCGAELLRKIFMQSREISSAQQRSVDAKPRLLVPLGGGAASVPEMFPSFRCVLSGISQPTSFLAEPLSSKTGSAVLQRKRNPRMILCMRRERAPVRLSHQHSDSLSALSVPAYAARVVGQELGFRSLVHGSVRA